MVEKLFGLALCLFRKAPVRHLVFICLALCICNGLVYADVVTCTQLGPYIIPIKSENISIEEENLEVTMHDKWSRIKARFKMRNNGALQDVQVGLPQVVLRDETYHQYAELWGPVRKEGIWDILIIVDGNAVPYQVSTGVKADDQSEEAFFRTEQGTLIKIPTGISSSELFEEKDGSAILNWLTWRLQFQRGQVREISLAYYVENTNYKGHLRLLYLLETARLWQNGIIRKINITADFGEGLSISQLKKEKPSLAGGVLRRKSFRGTLMTECCRYEVIDGCPRGYHIDKGKLKWSFKDFKPENFSMAPRKHSCDFTQDHLIIFKQPHSRQFPFYFLHWNIQR